MNCCLLILLLLFCGQNGNGICGQSGCGRSDSDRSDCGRSDCGCEQPDPPCRRPEPEPCPCEDSRFEPRFEQRPFSGNGSTCGCEGDGN